MAFQLLYNAQSIEVRHFLRTQIIANCNILFPSAIPEVVTSFDKKNNPELFVICRKSGKILVDIPTRGFYQILVTKTSIMINEYIVKQKDSTVMEDSKAPCGTCTLRDENDKLRAELSRLQLSVQPPPKYETEPAHRSFTTESGTQPH